MPLLLCLFEKRILLFKIINQTYMEKDLQHWQLWNKKYQYLPIKTKTQKEKKNSPLHENVLDPLLNSQD